MPTDAIECPLCLGEGKLKRTEVPDMAYEGMLVAGRMRGWHGSRSYEAA
jgi:hypothetical protein